MLVRSQRTVFNPRIDSPLFAYHKMLVIHNLTILTNSIISRSRQICIILMDTFDVL